MASPTIESLCCVTTNNPFSQDIFVDFHTTAYNVVSIIASLLGICGAIYQILPREPVSGVGMQGRQLFKTRGKQIIKWLAIVDLLAALGILIRSVVWVTDSTIGSNLDSGLIDKVFCVTSSAWIHFFYTATYFWTFVYAIDVKLVLEERKINQNIYHIVCWLIPALLCLGGLMTLYLPDLDCHDTDDPYERFLPNYLSTFIPIIMVMVFNPILYCIAFSRVEQLLTMSRGRFTSSERRVVHGLKMKFFLINLVFYVCWLPNVINGITLWISWEVLPKTFLIVLWYLMAILNPLQAVFNSIVYSSWETTSYIKLPPWAARLLPWRPASAMEVNTQQKLPSQASTKFGFSQADVGADHFWSRMFKHPSAAEKTPLLFMGKHHLIDSDDEIDTSRSSVRYQR